MRAKLSLLVCCILLGCERPAAPPSPQRVAGVVTLGGRPIPQAQLCFHPQGAGRVAVGMTGADGRFELTTQTLHDGALPGDYVVTVVWPNNSLAQDECLDPTTHDRLNGLYGDATKTPLRATVGPGANDFHFKIDVGGGSWSFPKRREMEKR